MRRKKGYQKGYCTLYTVEKEKEKGKGKGGSLDSDLW